MTPLIILHGVEARWRRRSDSTLETSANFLPQPSYLLMCSVAGLDTNIFYTWGTNFFAETTLIRRNYKKLLLVMNGYSCHMSYRTLALLKTNKIIVAGLSVHKSHVLQPLDVGIFSPYKEAFRTCLSHRTITSSKDPRNDIYTVCELLCTAYHLSVTGQNAIGGFRRSGLWYSTARGSDSTQIRSEDFTFSSIIPECVSSLP